MGILMAVCMLLVLGMSVPSPIQTRLRQYQAEIVIWTFLAGAWNVFWYGLQHVGEFWGNAALVSGFLLMFNSLPRLQPERWPAVIKSPTQWLQAWCHAMPKVVSVLSLVALAGCAVLYIHTLILLNL